MHLLQAILMGIVQGLSEFLPISSSAHLVFTSNFYKVISDSEIVSASGEEVFVDIMLHLGTLIAVIIFYRKDLAEIIKAFFYGIKNRDFQNADFKTGTYILLGTILTAAVAVPLSTISEKLVYLPSIVGLLLVFTGLLLLFSEYYSNKFENKKNVSLKSAVWIGLAQGLASIPGFSRSGLTIATGLLSGTDRVEAARYSFLLSIPVILGASLIYPLVHLNINDVANYNWTAIIVGTIVSCVVGYLCIKYFIKFITKFSLGIFGYYCIIMGIVSFLFFM